MSDTGKNLLIGLLLFVLNISLFYYFWENNLILIFAFAVVSIFVMLLWADKDERFFYLAGFILGPVYDIMLVPAGVWSYGNPTIFNVPLWLPLIYGISTVAIVKIGKSAMKIFTG